MSDFESRCTAMRQIRAWLPRHSVTALAGAFVVLGAGAAQSRTAPALDPALDRGAFDPSITLEDLDRRIDLETERLDLLEIEERLQAGSERPILPLIYHQNYSRRTAKVVGVVERLLPALVEQIEPSLLGPVRVDLERAHYWLEWGHDGNAVVAAGEAYRSLGRALLTSVVGWDAAAAVEQPVSAATCELPRGGAKLRRQIARHLRQGGTGVIVRLWLPCSLGGELDAVRDVVRERVERAGAEARSAFDRAETSLAAGQLAEARRGYVAALALAEGRAGM